MQKYRVSFVNSGYGFIDIEAENEDEAVDKLQMGDYDDKDLVYKEGGVEYDGEVELLD